MAPDAYVGYYALFEGERPIAFFHTAVHGGRTRPVMQFVPSRSVAERDRVVWVDEPNPACLIPAKAVPISEAQWAAFQEVSHAPHA